MQGETNLIIDAIRKASRFLQRDYFELEDLQSSSTKQNMFAQKALNRTLKILYETLNKYYDVIIIDDGKGRDIVFTNKAVIIKIPDGFGNFTRSLPFFGIMVSLVSKFNNKIVVESAVMNFPALGEIYYAEKGNGVWLERYADNFPKTIRCRVSVISNLDEALLISDVSNVDFSKTISNNIRIFESVLYGFSLLICGKIDIMTINFNEISSMSFRFFVTESGGAININNNLIIASNFKLPEKIISLL